MPKTSTDKTYVYGHATAEQISELTNKMVRNLSQKDFVRLLKEMVGRVSTSYKLVKSNKS